MNPAAVTHCSLNPLSSSRKRSPRRLVSKAFTPRRIEELRPRIQAIVNTALDRIDAATRAVQDAFVAEQAMQCGYCIPGFIMGTVGLLNREPHPSPDQIREALAEHVCRCGTYQRIQRAIERAASEQS